jgi:hypothetical protein
VVIAHELAVSFVLCTIGSVTSPYVVVLCTAIYASIFFYCRDRRNKHH